MGSRTIAPPCLRTTLGTAISVCKTVCKTTVVLALGLIFALPVRADEPAEKAAGETDETVQAFRAGRVLPVDGPELENATILVRDGKIEAILGAGEEPPDDVSVIDLGVGAVVVPVFVNPLSQIHTLGSNVRGSRNGVISLARGSPTNQQKRKGSDAVDPRHEIYERLTRTGYGAVGIVPLNGSLVSGRASVVRPVKTEEKKDLILLDDGYLYLGYDLGKAWKTVAERELGKAIEEVKKLREAEKKTEKAAPAEEKERKDAPSKPDPKPKPPESGAKPARPGPESSSKSPAKPEPPSPLAEVFLGKRDVFLAATQPAVIDHGLRLLGGLEEKFDFVLVTSPQEEEIVAKLAKRREQIRGVVLEPGLTTIYDTSIYINSARMFAEAGLPVAFVPMNDDVRGHEDVLYYLAELIKAGLPRDRALRGVTIVPAEMLGIDDRLGSLSAGKEASFAVYDGDPFSGLAELVKVYFEGRQVFLAEVSAEKLAARGAVPAAVRTGPSGGERPGGEEEEDEENGATEDEKEGDGEGAAGSEEEKKGSADTEKEAAAKKKPVHAVVGGTVLPVSRPPIHRGTVLFQDGKILAVGSEIPIPEGAVVHSADGCYVTPGLVAVEGSLGNARFSGGNYADNLDPYQRDAHIALANGITTVHIVNAPFYGFFSRSRRAPSGQSSCIVKTTYKDLDGMLLKEPASVALSFRLSMFSVYDLKKKFESAADYLKQVREAEKAKKKPPKMPRNLSLYVEIVKGELPTFCAADDVDTIRVLLELRQRYGFQLILTGAQDGWKVARELTALDVPVAVKARGEDFNFDMESSLFEDDDMIPIRRPAAYATAGVRVALLPYRSGISLDGLAGRDLSALAFEAAFAIRGGMEEPAALRAITLEPARILGIDDRVGSLEKGKDADILLWSRHPLHYRSFVKTAWIGGKIYYEREKSRLYRDIPLGG